MMWRGGLLPPQFWQFLQCDKLSGDDVGHRNLKGKDKPIRRESLFWKIPSLSLCTSNSTSSWLLLIGDLVSTTLRLEVHGILWEPFMETGVWVLIGFFLAGLKEFAELSGDFLDSSESFSFLAMPSSSEGNTSSTRKKKNTKAIRKKTEAIIFNRLTVWILLKCQKSPKLATIVYLSHGVMNYKPLTQSTWLSPSWFHCPEIQIDSNDIIYFSHK